MTKQNISYKSLRRVMRFMLAMILGAFISAFSYGVCTAQAAETAVTVEENQVTSNENAEANGGGAMILLMGGMLIIILAVVISVVGTFVSTAAIVDEL